MDAATSVPKVPRKKPDLVDLAERTLRDFLAEMDRAADGAGKLELRPFLERFAATLDEHGQNERDACAKLLMSRHDESWSRWEPIKDAPKTAIIVAAWHARSKSWSVGEAHWVDDAKYDGGSWWWANIGPGDYHGDDIVNMGGMPMYYQPLPSPPSYDMNPTDAAHGGKIAN